MSGLEPLFDDLEILGGLAVPRLEGEDAFPSLLRVEIPLLFETKTPGTGGFQQENQGSFCQSGLY